jgi:SAM-dependent methyltransferase
MPRLTSQLLAGLPKTGATDPIEFYRRPLVGYLFRERINIGLRLLGDCRFERVLEVGFGAGAVLLAVAPIAHELFGIDLEGDPDAVRRIVEGRNVRADLRKGSVYRLPYDDGFFDLVLSYSVFEHLHDYALALAEVARVLRPRGRFLLGMPAVNKGMEWGFRAIRFRGIEDHHVTTPAQVARRFGEAGFVVVADDRLGPRGLPTLAMYHVWLLEKRGR